MRILPVCALALVGAGCEPFFDPDIGEGEGEFDGIPEEPFHEDFDPLPDRPELDLENVRIQAVEQPDLVEVRPGLVGLPFEQLDVDLVEFEIDGQLVQAEVSLTPGPSRLFGLVQWRFGDGEPVEATVIGDVHLDP